MALIEKLVEIGDAIRAKRGWADLIPLSDMPAAIEGIEGAVEGSHSVTVRFVDENGAAVADDVTLTCDEKCEYVFAPPEVDGLFPSPSLVRGVASEDAEVIVLYEPWDYETVFDISLTNASYLSPEVGLYVNGSATIDWGDGSAAEIVTGNGASVLYAGHAYESVGDYRIVITAASRADTIELAASGANYSCLGRHTNYRTICTHCSFGMNVTGLRAYACRSWVNCEFEELPDSIAEIAMYAFYGCTLAAFERLPSSLATVGNNAFASCPNIRLTELPDTVTLIDGYGFAGCTRLVEIDASESLSSIGEYAFNACSGLKSLVFHEGLSDLPKYLCQQCSALETFIAKGAAVVGTYQLGTSGNTVLSQVQLGSPGYPVSSIASAAFTKCTNANLEITVYTVDGGALANAPWGATNAKITYLQA